MKIKIDQSEKISVVDLKEELERVWADCLNSIYDEDRLIHHVNIDGQIFYSDYENYINNNLDLIKEVHINTFSRLESITETETTLSEYLVKYIPGMEEITNKLYGDVSPETWEEFATGLKGLQWIVSSLEFLRLLYAPGSEKSTHIQDYCSQLSQIVKELDKEMQSNNLVGVADLLQYELSPCLIGFLSEEK